MSIATAILAAIKKPFAKERPSFNRGPPPQEAIDWMKTTGIEPAFSYSDTWRQEQDFAFYVSKMVERDLLELVHKSLTRAVEDGVPFKEWSQSVEDVFDQSGWSDYNGKSAGNPSRLYLIYDTNIATARSAGQSERIERTKDFLPYLRYDVGPTKVRSDGCAPLDGLVLHADDEFWLSHTPPLHFNCQCSLTQRTEDQASQEDRWGDDAPEFKWVNWTNKDTGKTSTVPEHVLPGFGVNQFKARGAQLEELALEREQGDVATPESRAKMEATSDVK